MNLSKKFKSLDNFYAEFNYELLPFRFIQLDSQRYVITNFVGEFLLISRSELESLVTKKIQCGSSLYNDLKGKHFIYDTDVSSAIKLLGLKYRSQKYSIAQFTALHIFVVTLRCDYSCPYCQVSRQTTNKTKYDMTNEIAEKSLNLVFKTPSKQIKIEFQGGESLLNFDLIKKIVIDAKQINKTEKRILQFVIATNLSFLNEEILNFCLKHNILLSTSLDGPEDLHNKNRPKNGKNGYELTSIGIRKAQEALGKQNISALMTTTQGSLSRAQDIIDTYISFGFDSIFLRPLSPYGFAVKTKQLKYDTENWINFYKKGLNYIIEINKKGYFLAEQYASIILSKIFNPLSSGYVDLQSPAGIGISAIVYNYNGNIYASDEARMLAEMNDDTFKLGTVDDDYENIFLSNNLLEPLELSLAESAPMCNDCAFLPYCGSDPVYHHATQNDFVGNKSISGFCSKNMNIFRYLISLLSDDQDARKILMSWIRR